MAPTLADPFQDYSALFEFVINQGNGVKGLSELGLKVLPKQYIQPLEERTCMSNIVPQESIPIIDMSNWQDPEMAKSICDAASKWGFFQIVNYDVPIHVLDNVKDATYREQVLDYMKKSEVVIKQLLQILMKGCHSDFSTLTILLQDEIRGLFVRENDGDNWIHVPPIKGSLVINVGDTLQIMTNRRYRSVEQRVVANGSNNIISVPIFVNPRPSDMLRPLLELIVSGEKLV
ncbi:Feruloyl CoA ortho-hydroxylase 2 [Hibiscus syriacus]|uniref:Feruloyl CoA ortho-hydroxylase 2 n=1 Tax=Hibiscus syriacus TaxID=106335 RepID=A0A6A3CX44_HIBSY|nr:Feruloyl CoA ortho-hydroxylase 2 [Hibiscus syriacus]